jgi:hypothetical protein
LSSNTNIGNTPVNQGYVQLIHMGETGGIDGTLRALYDGDGTASDLLIASDKVKISTTLYIGSDTLQEYIQDTVGAMLVTNASHTNLSAAYDDAGDGAIDLTASGDVTLSNTVTLTNKTLTAPTLTGTTQGASITLSGDLTVNGTTTTVNQTNLDVSDNIIGLNRGAGSNANDSGLIIERGSTGNNAAIIWDESADKFTLGTTTSTPSATGDLTISTGTLVANLEGNVTGNVTGNADTATKIASITNSDIVQLTSSQTLTNKTLTSPIIDSVTISTIQTGSESFADNDTSLMTSAAVQDKITSYGYTTNTGDITGVTAGTNCSGGGTSGGVTINVDDAFLKNDADDTTTGKITSNGLILPASHSTDKILMYSGGNEKIGTEANTFLFTADNFKFKDTNGDANLFMNNSGNVGIGTTSPSYNLHVKSASGAHAEVRIETPNDSTVPALSFNNGNQIYSVGIMSDEDFVIRDASSSWAERFAINTSGDIKISESLGIGVAANGTAGRLDCSNDVVAFASSDKRLKENIKPLDNALDKVLKISGVEFDWKELTEEEKKTIHGNEGHDVGVIAQEIEEVLPEVVTTRDNGYKAVKYEKILPLLIEAIKEQQEEIDLLKANLDQLKYNRR